MTQANLEQFALNNGMNSNIQAMSQQEQLMLRYSYVMQSLNQAQGDFARTQYSWANQTRILSEQFKELLSIIGNGLIQVLLPVVQFLNKILGYVISITKAIGRVLSKLLGLKKPAENVSKPMGAISSVVSSPNKGLGKGAKNMNKLGKATKNAAKEAKGALANFDDLNILVSKDNSSNIANPANNPLSAGLGDINIPDYNDFAVPEIDTINLDKFEQKIYDSFNKIKDFLVKYKIPITSAIAGITSAFSFYNIAKNWPLIISALKGFVASFTSILAGISWPLVALSALIGLVVAAVVELWQTNDSFKNSVIDSWNQVKEMFSNVFNGVRDVLVNFWDIYTKPIMEGLSNAWRSFVEIVDKLWQQILKPVFDGFIELINMWWNNVGQPVFNAFMTLIGEVGLVVLSLWNDIFAPLIKWLIDVFSPVIENLVNNVLGFFEHLWTSSKPIFDNLTAIIESVGEFLRSLLKFVGSVFSGDWESTWEDLKASFFELWNSIKEFVNTTWEAIKKIFEPVYNWFNDNVISPIKRIFDSMWTSVKNFASHAWRGIKSVFSSVAKWFDRNVVQPLSKTFKGMWDGIKKIASDTWDGILRLFEAGGKIFLGIKDGIGNLFKTIINGLLRGVNKVISTPFKFLNSILNNIRSISVLGIAPFKGLWSYNPVTVPHIPYLDVGTNYVQKSGLAMIHEGEAVVPKQYNPALGNSGSDEQIQLLKEQNSLLRDLLNKDNSTYIDGDVMRANSEKRRREELNRLGLSY